MPSPFVEVNGQTLLIDNLGRKEVKYVILGEDFVTVQFSDYVSLNRQPDQWFYSDNQKSYGASLLYIKVPIELKDTLHHVEGGTLERVNR